MCLENWEKSKESYNVASNDTTWKKIKLESKVLNDNYFLIKIIKLC